MELDTYSIPVLNKLAAREIYRAAGWGKFISVVGFVISAIIIFVGLVINKIISYAAAFNPQLAVMPGWWFTIFYILIGILYFFPSLFLYRFSAKSKKALLENNENILAFSFSGLRLCLQFIGVVTLIFLILYVLVIMGLLIGSALGISMS